MEPRTTAPSDHVGLLRRSHSEVARVLEQISPQQWEAAGGCEKWTVRQTADHLAGALLLLARFAEGEQPDPAELDEQRQADTDHLGADPAAAFRAIADRSVAAFTTPGILERPIAFMGTTVPGAVLASISLQESLIHGWDIATGAHLPYHADDTVVRMVWQHAETGIGDTRRRTGQFAPAIPVPPTAPLLTRLLAHLGRQA
ncbi:MULTISPECIES: TIGR03086 family metal-binding protein [Nonomuraea]|uniref:TIGR03086 family metal-binding protein n=1 Tax=Nonomuraea salmonea TaxID=46181 RepID=A0ABV5NUZ3_9ACTN